jgi:hypothetical protein
MSCGQPYQGLQGSDSDWEYPRIALQSSELEILGSHFGPLGRQELGGLVGELRLHFLGDGEVLLEEGSGEDLLIFGGMGERIVLLEDLGLAFVVVDFGL